MIPPKISSEPINPTTTATECCKRLVIRCSHYKISPYKHISNGYKKGSPLFNLLYASTAISNKSNRTLLMISNISNHTLPMIYNKISRILPMICNKTTHI